MRKGNEWRLCDLNLKRIFGNKFVNAGSHCRGQRTMTLGKLANPAIHFCRCISQFLTRPILA
jgi:hypothetical protein